MKLLARVFIILLFLLPIVYCLLPTQVHAQYEPNPYTTPNTDSNVVPNLHTYTQSVVMEVLSALTCQIIGIDPMTSNKECLGVNTTTGKIGYVPSNGGAVGFFGTMIASLYTPPAHTADFVNYVARDFGFTKHAYADTKTNGIGFDKLTPLLSLWTTFRNISYLFFVVIFVVVGFAIMLRVKIDPRTVMTIENQIPKIIVGLLLVTFSYAIAGFLIDMMYVTTYLTVNVITASQQQAGNTDTVNQIKNTETSDLAGGNPIGFMNDIIPGTAALPGGIIALTAGSAGSVKDIVQHLFTPEEINNKSSSNPAAGWIWGTITGVGVGVGCAVLTGTFTFGLSIIPCLLLGGGVGAATGITVNGFDLGDVVTAALGTALSWVAGLLAFFIIAIAILVALFRVWFSLLLTYVMILVEIVLAPFYIIAGLIPGSKIGFGMWLRSMVGNLLAFPVTVAMFLLAGVFMQNFATAGANIFVPPLIGNPQGGAGRSPVAYLVALGMVLLTPSVVSMTRGILGAPENKFLATIGQSLGGAAGVGINTGKNIGRTIMGQREFIAGPNGQFRQRGWGASIFGNLLGR